MGPEATGPRSCPEQGPRGALAVRSPDTGCPILILTEEVAMGASPNDPIELDLHDLLDADSEFALLPVRVTFRATIQGPPIPTTLDAGMPENLRLATVEYAYRLPRHIASDLMGHRFWTPGVEWEVTAVVIDNRNRDTDLSHAPAYAASISADERKTFILSRRSGAQSEPATDK